MQVLLCRFYRVADSIVQMHRTNSIVQILLCNSTMRISLCRWYCACYFMHIPLFPSSAFYQRHPIVRMRILSCGFYRADSIVQIQLCGFHRADSIVQILVRMSLCGFHGEDYRADFTVWISWWGLLCDSIVRIPSWGLSCKFHREDSFICLPSSAFHCLHSNVSMPLCAFHRVHCIVR